MAKTIDPNAVIRALASVLEARYGVKITVELSGVDLDSNFFNSVVVCTQREGGFING